VSDDTRRILSLDDADRLAFRRAASTTADNEQALWAAVLTLTSEAQRLRRKEEERQRRGWLIAGRAALRAGLAAFRCYAPV
jgi:hypothetical protein